MIRPSPSRVRTEWTGPREECGVFGVYAPGDEVARLAYFGLYALQHRGQESAGIATSNGEQIIVFKDMGLVSQVFDEGALASLSGHIAVGHNRYSTAGESTWANAQPTLGPTAHGTLALAHNGNLTNTTELLEMLVEREGYAKRLDLRNGGCTDTAILAALMASDRFSSLEETVLDLFPSLKGAYCLVFMDETRLYGVRDPHGVHPLVLGELKGRGWVLASETAALDIIGSTMVREIEPGEMVVIDGEGVRFVRFGTPTPHGCVFEYVYLARPDTIVAGRSIHVARTTMGQILAREHPADADLVIPVPESGTPAAVGYARESGIPFSQGFVKNAYVGRTFIQPSQALRQLGIRLKLNPLREVIGGKRLVIVDDSIVRGNTQKAIVAMLRDAGAAEVHVRISSPPVLWPCFYGVDFPTRGELAAVGKTTEDIRKLIGADSLGHISYEGMVEATGQVESALCTACFSGRYPIEPPPEALPLLTENGKHP